MIGCLLSVTVGCPLIASIMNCLMTSRFFAESYPATQGVTCMEMVARCMLCCCVRFDRVSKKPGAQDDLFAPPPEEEEEGKGNGGAGAGDQENMKENNQELKMSE